MKTFFVVLAVLSSSLFTNASHNSPLLSRHAIHSRKPVDKQCPDRKNRFVRAPTPAPQDGNDYTVEVPNAGDWDDDNDNNNDNSGGNAAGNGGGFFSGGGECGDSGATDEITATSGPMGSIDYLNCGLEGAGWKPPPIHLSDLKYISLEQALSMPGSPFQACSEYIWMFDKYGNDHGIPPIMMASFALQESTCNPATTGSGGEVGLMQLSPDKCWDAPGGNCYNPEFNIRRGAEFIASKIEELGGMVVQALGAWNGWEGNMTLADATAAHDSECCRCQNNADYLHQVLNGWMQGHDAYSGSPRLGKYFNLDDCP